MDAANARASQAAAIAGDALTERNEAIRTGAGHGWDELVRSAELGVRGPLNRDRKQDECRSAVRRALASHREAHAACYARGEAASLVKRTDRAPAGAIALDTSGKGPLAGWWVLACSPDPSSPR